MGCFAGEHAASSPICGLVVVRYVIFESIVRTQKTMSSAPAAVLGDDRTLKGGEADALLTEECIGAPPRGHGRRTM